ncbi:DoxX family membrane protein [Roseomonas eburnea]|uniref:DoxX family membrane protein n=1 Tax=Neoroseomonas eburnea TaxID=1346889 RepID=A0A9X9XHN5_9PROT|nr:DoxX family membrane protein [Neoroseomonas eburnea]MBR0683221.1 DoxX family membrane protein [Neoroseomonas eburnea]
MIRRLTIDVPRILLGLLFLVAAVDGFTWMLTGQRLIHPPTSAAGLRFEDGLKESGFIWPLMKTIDLVAGLCLLFNRFPALALLFLLPIITVIILFHLVLNPGGIPVAAVLAVLTGMLLFGYRDRYLPLLR